MVEVEVFETMRFVRVEVPAERVDESVAAPVTPSVPEKVPSPPARVPSVAVCEKRFVELAVVEKRFVVVAFPSETFPLEVRFAAVSVVPSNVRFALSVKAPAVVIYGTRFAVRAETVRFVVEAVPK